MKYVVLVLVLLGLASTGVARASVDDARFYVDFYGDGGTIDMQVGIEQCFKSANAPDDYATKFVATSMSDDNQELVVYPIIEPEIRWETEYTQTFTSYTALFFGADRYQLEWYNSDDRVLDKKTIYVWNCAPVLWIPLTAK